MNYRPIQKSKPRQRVIPYGLPIYNSDIDELGEKIYTFITLPTSPFLGQRVRISDSNTSTVGTFIIDSGPFRGIAKWGFIDIVEGWIFDGGI